MDVMVLCSGGVGDNTGMAQNKRATVSMKPKLGGRLPYPPTQEVDCEKTLDEYEGDPGSIFIFKCPPGCAAESTPVYGYLVYHPHSSVCRAAIHSRTINDDGGMIQVLKMRGQEGYESKLSYKI